MDNRISIIVPIYNVEEYIGKCIESIINQTYKKIEIILVDDGSTDNCNSICQKYKELDSRIIIINQCNKGLVLARKAGLDVSTGEYVIFVDGDDYIESELCQKMLEHILMNDVDFIHANYIENDSKVVRLVEKKQRFEMCNLSDYKKIEIISSFVFDSMINKEENQLLILPSIWSKIFRSDFIKNYYDLVPNEQSLGEDLICLCHMLMNCNSFSVVTDAYYHYNLRDNSLSHKFDLENIANTSSLFLRIKELFINYGCWNDIKESVRAYYEFSLWDMLKSFETKSFHINRFYYPNVNELFGKKIVIYGAGKVGKDFYDQICRYKDIELVNWVDKNYKRYTYEYYHVNDISELTRNNYDYVLIAVKEKNIVDMIKDDLVNSGIDNNKLLWKVPDENVLN